MISPIWICRCCATTVPRAKWSKQLSVACPGPDRLLLWILPGFFLSLLAHVASPLLSPFSGFKLSWHPVMFRRGWAYAVFFYGSDECLVVVQLYLYRGHSRKHTHPWLLETCIFDLSIYCSSLPQLSALGSDLIPTHQSRRRPNMLWSKWASRRQALR
jgi:hypothetical protein